MLFDSELSLDTFRTTIWRMKDKEYAVSGDTWTVKNDGGRYWKISTDIARGVSDPFADYGNSASKTSSPAWDEDPEVPF